MATPPPTYGQQQLTQLLDALITRSQEIPGVEYTFWMSPETVLLVPWDNNEAKLFRVVEGRLGYYRSASYRDHEIVSFPNLEDEVRFVPLLGSGPGSEQAPDFRAHLHTGVITSSY